MILFYSLINELESLEISDITDVKGLITDLTSTVASNKTSEQTDITDVKNLITNLTSTVIDNYNTEQSDKTTLLSQISSLTALEASDVAAIKVTTDDLQTQIKDNYNTCYDLKANQQGQINGNLANHKKDKAAMKSDISDIQDGQAALAASVATDFLAVGVITAALQTQINATNVTVGLMEVDIAFISDNIKSLQNKTQNTDLTLTNAFSTCVKNEFKISNLSNDKVVLNDTKTGFNYFYNRSVFENDIHLDPTNKIISSDCSKLNIGGEKQEIINLQTKTLDGVINLTGKEINLNTDSNLKTTDNTILNIGNTNQGGINLIVSTLDGVINITGETINLNSQYITCNNEALDNYLAGGFQIGNSSTIFDYY